MRYIKDNQVLEDDWKTITDPANQAYSSTDDIILPYKYWTENRDSLTAHEGRLTIYIEGDDPVEALDGELASFDLLGLSFPMFKDGRCYSHARLLRERYGYKGELRAVGDVLRDQLFYMKRCGIDAYSLQEGSDYDAALQSLSDFSHAYQGAADDTIPISKLR